ncbi:PREDICTED: uncharacterized protein K02A2.6-like [Priapulus caudatus]|uniref:RNA-directed DNA polymerase n=1 Tax=Priapulus caudatus TaxID=37621 RepID=A0ABM1EF61_PRICU|nr:PREDICTED: uncharacterized protein K02A2.6-like [Priapulus caudatus]
MHSDILSQLHQGHQGVEKTRRLARESVYWVNISKDIEHMCRACKACQVHQDANKREPLVPHATPARPWQLIASDLFEINNQQYLIVADRYTKYPLVDVMPTPVSSQAVANKIKAYCALFGRPDELMTDNGPQYTGQAFTHFVKSWSIKHVTSSPHYPQSNGFIERHIRHVKPIIKKTLECGEDLQMAFLNIRATPVDTDLPSPGELMFGRPLITLLPSHGEPGPSSEREQLQNRNEKMQQQTPDAHQLPPLHVGQRVRILDKGNKTWCPGEVVARHEQPRSYVVETPNGTRLRRNRSHLRELTTGRMEKLCDEESNQASCEAAMSSANDQGDTSPQDPSSGTDRIQREDSSPGKTRYGRAVRLPARFQE